MHGGAARALRRGPLVLVAVLGLALAGCSMAPGSIDVQARRGPTSTSAPSPHRTRAAELARRGAVPPTGAPSSASSAASAPTPTPSPREPVTSPPAASSTAAPFPEALAPTTVAPDQVPPTTAPLAGCRAAIEYLARHAAPGFTFVCPGDALGHQAMTCVNTPSTCPNQKLIVIADPSCTPAIMN